MSFTQTDATKLRNAANDLSAMLVAPSQGQTADANVWRDFLAKLLAAIGPELLALLIALLTETKQTTP